MRRIGLWAALIAGCVLSTVPAFAQEEGQTYVVTWTERAGGSYQAYEDMQRRVLQLFEQWQAPGSVTVEQFVVRVGEFGGYAFVRTNDLKALHEATIPYATFSFEVAPVLDVQVAAEAERNAVAWRESVGPLQ